MNEQIKIKLIILDILQYRNPVITFISAFAVFMHLFLSVCMSGAFIVIYVIDAFI